jgi:hypothetical protein
MKRFLVLIFLITQTLIFADNPLVKDIGMSDPHVRVFNNKVYLYCGHDSSRTDKTWTMKNWRVFSSNDLVNWKFENYILPKDNYMGENTHDCWAGDAVSKDGKFYFYFSDRKRGIGVMKANKPTGIFKDPLGKALISPMHDPTCITDDDGSSYIIYGDKEGDYKIVRLNEDMISLAETPKTIIIKGKEWENAPKWMDKNYIFKYNGRFYLSWGRDYAVSNNIYGPYQCWGKVGEGFNLNEFAHGSFFWWKGQFYHIWCHYIKGAGTYRETQMTYCHFDEVGRIHTDTRFLEKHYSNGVGQYTSDWEKIEAEWYYEKSNSLVKEYANDNGTITGITNGSWLRYQNFKFKANPQKVKLKFDELLKKTDIEIRVGSKEGKLIGKYFSESVTNEIIINIDQVEVIADLYIVFKSIEHPNVKFDWFKFF